MVDPVGTVGAVTSCSMNAATNITTTNAQEVYSNSTGAKKALLYFSAPSADTGYVAVGWSSTVDDAANINTLIDAKTTDRAANTGAGNGDEVPQVEIFYPAFFKVNPIVLNWDGETTIKTIVCESHAPATAAALPYELVLVS
jgi:hypothetical protein